MRLALTILLTLSSINLYAKESLREQLLSKAQASAAKTPEKAKKIMMKAITDLKSSEVMNSALKKGDKIPSFALQDATKGKISSASLLKKGPVIITFYRGAWCPYCNLQLRDLQQHIKAIKATGAELVAISPEKPDSTLKTVKKQKLDFYVLSDSNSKVGKEFGLMFNLDPELKKLYSNFGIDLAASNSSKKWELPLAATYIVDQNGMIIYSFVDADYKKRAETTELIKILKGLKKS